MKNHKKFKKAFGLNEHGYIDFPKKISNVKLSRIENCRLMGGCSFCFPHGIETTNSKYLKQMRSWKEYRLMQYKRK